MRKGLRTPIALLALCSAAFFAVDAVRAPVGAQTPPVNPNAPAAKQQPASTNQSGGPAKAPPATGGPKQQTTAKSESVLRKPLADAPEGIPVGDFVFHAKGEADIEFDDNIYRTPTATNSDFIARIRPGATLQSTWDEHALDFYVQTEFAKYLQYSSEDYTAFAFGGRGRYDVNEETTINALLEYSRAVLPRGSPGVGTSAGSATASVIRAATDVTYNGEPIYLRFGPRYEYRIYDGQGPSDNHHFLDLNGRVGYRISEEFSVFVDPSYQFVRYINQPDSTGFFRNSQGFDVKVGVTYDISTTLGAEVAIGFYRRWFEDARLLPDSGLSARAAVYWNPTETLSFEIEGRRSLTEYRLAAGTTGAATASGNAVETSFSARAGYLVLENLLLDIGGTYANYDFGAIGRTDKYYGIDVGAKYFFTPNFYVGPRYYYSTRQSTDPLAGFNDNRILLTLGARL